MYFKTVFGVVWTFRDSFVYANAEFVPFGQKSKLSMHESKWVKHQPDGRTFYWRDRKGERKEMNIFFLLFPFSIMIISVVLQRGGKQLVGD